MVGAPHSQHNLLLELGRGGMGTVYLAVARGPAGFSKLKVVKRLRADLANDEQFLTMFLDEARLTARLNHPNIVQTNEVGFDGTNYFIEMEYLEGQSLDALGRRAAKAGGLPLEAAIFVLTQVLAGLHYAHELRDHSGPLRVVHRDVSPHNVFVTYDGAVKVLDFGIAKAADSSNDTTTGVVKGKATYMSPEQATRGTVDRRADIFSVGVMLWETLTHRRLWAGLSDFEIFLALQKGAPPSAGSVEAGVPAELDSICTKALGFAAEDRFETAAAMQLALEEELAKRSTRVGARSLAAIMSELFSDRRAAVQEEIDSRLRELEEGAAANTRASVDVPVLGQAKAYVETSTGPTRTKNLALQREDATRPSSPSAQRLRAEGDDAGTSAPSGDRGRTRSAVISAVPPPISPRRSAMWIAAAGVALALATGMGAFAVARSASTRPAAGPGAGVERDAARLVSCARNADCVAAGRGAPGPVCSERGVCIASQGCATNAECAARNDGKASVCNRELGKCVVLESEDCRPLAEPGDADSDETIWFGLMFPRRGPESDSFRVDNNVVELARRDFVTTTNGLPSHTPGAPPRPLAVLACDDSLDPKRAAAHLVEAAVPAVIGFGHAKEVIDLYALTFLPGRTLLIETINTNAMITQLSRPADGFPRLVWRTTENAVQCAAPLAAFVSEWLEPRLATLQSRKAATRVALVRAETSSSLTAADAFVPALRIDGKEVVANSDAFLQIVMHSDADQRKTDEVVSALTSFAPNVVVYLNQDFADRILPRVESEWPKGVSHRPTYVAAGNVIGGSSAYAFVGRSAERRHRFFGVELPANTTANLRFVLRYNETFSPAITPGTAPGVDYDAFYLLAYAAAAAGERRITGVALAESISRLLPPGEPVEVGPGGIFEAVNALARGENIDLVGAGTALDMDPTTGESPSDFAIYCMKPDANGVAADMIESGLKYDSRLRKLTGLLHCP